MGWNCFINRRGDNNKMNYAIMLGLIAAILAALAGFLLKRGAVNIIFKGIFNKKLILALMIYAVSMICFVIALKLGKLYMIYGLAAINFSLVSILGLIFYKEKRNLRKLLGLVMVVFGIVLLSL